MNLFELPFLADENIHPAVIQYLKQRGSDVKTVWDENLNGHDDATILQRASDNGRVVLTHDSDFGTIAITQNVPFIGIIYLRPGHIRPEFTIETLQAIAEKSLNVLPAFILVAERSRQTVKIRVRQQE